MKTLPQLTHPEHPALRLQAAGNRLVCADTGESFPISNGIPRLVPQTDAKQAQTMDAFAYKWSRTPNFGTRAEHHQVFLQAYREWFGIESWDDFAPYLKDKVVLDAGCGSGRGEYFWGRFPSKIVALDISGAIDVAKSNWHADPRFAFVQGDVLKLPYPDGSFEVVWSEGVLHHTPSTHAALRSCVRVLQPGGLILFYIYRKKAPLREFADDYIRNEIAELPPEEAWESLEPLTRLAKAFSDLNTTVTIPEDVSLLGFKAGAYSVQRFLYYNVMKFYWNDGLTFDENVHVNFDWYYPKYCWRHTVAEVRDWLAEFGLEEVSLREADSGIGVIAKKKAA